MERREPPPRREVKSKPPRWNSPLWYLPLMLLLLWVWQSTLSQFSYRTIGYSEFKDHLRRKEVVSCVVREDEVQGKIKPVASVEAQPGALTTTNASAGANGASKTNAAAA